MTLNKIEFKSYPLAAYPLRGFFAIAVIILVVALSYLLTGYAILPIFAFLICTMPVVNFLFPSKYTFEDDELRKFQIGYDKRIKLSQYQDFIVGKDGILIVKNKRKNEYIYIFNEDIKSKVRAFLLEKGIHEIKRGA
ncbi:MAG: hypothetical protein KAQ98_11730 [Bacteriovoracaceae bacterium]|nr:hypothetical protein [Bacteriovoracaceae bacterium]